MFSEPPTTFAVSRPEFEQDPFVSYSRALHDYTLGLWTESRRVAEEKARNKTTRRDEEASRRRKEFESFVSQPQRSTTHIDCPHTVHSIVSQTSYNNSTPSCHIPALTCRKHGTPRIPTINHYIYRPIATHRDGIIPNAFCTIDTVLRHVFVCFVHQPSIWHWTGDDLPCLDIQQLTTSDAYMYKDDTPSPRWMTWLTYARDGHLGTIR
ncbi:hypothetical protein V8B97DRAFT_637076 [Scleroderma yunnanense]